MKNEDLWRALGSITSKHKVKWHWFKGHAGHEGNERCDLLANEEIAKLMKTFTHAQPKAALLEFTAKERAKQAAGDLFAA